MKIIMMVIMLFALSCKGPEHHGLQEVLHKDSANIPLEPGYSPVLFTRKTHAFYAPLKAETLQVLERESRIKQFPCSGCHNEDWKPDQEHKVSHWNIKLNHADSSIMNCRTCHDPEPGGNGALRKLNGEHISYNEAFQLCAQCHMSQWKDFQGGAHGKRFAIWRGNRIVSSCTECHNPHDPKIPTRWPARKSPAPKGAHP